MKKLSLKKETLRHLSVQQLTAVRSGVAAGSLDTCNIMSAGSLDTCNILSAGSLDTCNILSSAAAPNGQLG